MRGDGPTIFTSVREGKGVDDIVTLILAAWRTAGSPGKLGPVGEEVWAGHVLFLFHPDGAVMKTRRKKKQTIWKAILCLVLQVAYPLQVSLIV